jgi:hypothetical protein
MRVMAGGKALPTIGFLVAIAAAALSQGPESAASRPARGVIQGIVVGEGRFPAPGVVVTRQVSGQESERTLTDALGRFRFEPPFSEGGGIVLGAIRAFSGKLAAELPFDAHRATIDGILDVGRIALLPATQVRVRVLADGAAVPGARVSIGRNYTLVAEAPTDASGLVTFEGLVTVGEDWKTGFTLGALAPDGRVGSAHVTVGSRPDQTATIELVPPRTFQLTVLDAVSGRGIAGARSEVLCADEGWLWRGPWTPVKHSDQSGSVLVEAPPLGPRTPVWIRAGGYEEWTGDLAPSGPHAHEIRLDRRPAQSWQVTDSPERPPDGAAVAVYSIYDVRRKKPFTGRIEKGELTVSWGAPERELGLAIASDGAFADLYGGSPVVFRKPREIQIDLRWDDGTPAAGIRLWTAALTEDISRAPALVSDETGRVRASVLSDRELSWEWQPGLSGFHSDSVDLSGGETKFTKTSLRHSTVELRVTIDGKRRLPA